jgi:hypothetical protein
VRRTPLLVIGATLVLTGGVFAFTGYADAAGAAMWILTGLVCMLLSNGRPS